MNLLIQQLQKEDLEHEEMRKIKKADCAISMSEEYKDNSTYPKDDQKFDEFVKGQKFKQCPKCKYWVEKNQDNHMTYICSMPFCYVCGGNYLNCNCQNA